MAPFRHTMLQGDLERRVGIEEFSQLDSCVFSVDTEQLRGCVVHLSQCAALGLDQLHEGPVSFESWLPTSMGYCDPLCFSSLSSCGEDTLTTSQDGYGSPSCDQPFMARYSSFSAKSSDGATSAANSLESRKLFPPMQQVSSAISPQPTPIKLYISCSDNESDLGSGSGPTPPSDACCPSWQGLDPTPGVSWIPREQHAVYLHGNSVNLSGRSLMALMEAEAIDNRAWPQECEADCDRSRRRSSTGYLILTPASGDGNPVHDGRASWPRLAQHSPGLWPAMHPPPTNGPLAPAGGLQGPSSAPTASCLPLGPFSSSGAPRFMSAAAETAAPDDGGDDEDEDDDLLSPRPPPRFPSISAVCARPTSDDAARAFLAHWRSSSAATFSPAVAGAALEGPKAHALHLGLPTSGPECASAAPRGAVRPLALAPLVAAPEPPTSPSSPFSQAGSVESSSSAKSRDSCSFHLSVPRRELPDDTVYGALPRLSLFAGSLPRTGSIVQESVPAGCNAVTDEGVLHHQPMYMKYNYQRDPAPGRTLAGAGAGDLVRADESVKSITLPTWASDESSSATSDAGGTAGLEDAAEGGLDGIPTWILLLALLRRLTRMSVQGRAAVAAWTVIVLLLSAML